MRGHPAPSIDHGTDGCSHLNRRDLETTVQISWSQAPPVRYFPLFMHNGSRLSRKIDPVSHPEVRIVKIVIKPLCPSLSPISINTGLQNSGFPAQMFRSMSAHFVTPDFPVFDDFISRTGKCIVQCDSPFRQAAEVMILKVDRLIGIIDTSVSPHLIEKILLSSSSFHSPVFKVNGSFRLNSGYIYHG